MMSQTCNRYTEQYFIYKAITIRLYVLWLRDIVQMMDAVFGVVMKLFSKCLREVQITCHSSSTEADYRTTRLQDHAER